MKNLLFKDLFRRISLCLLMPFMIGGVHADPINQAPLDPEKRNRVRDVGHALLQAKRSYEPENAAGIRRQVKIVRDSITVLTKPLTSARLTANDITTGAAADGPGVAAQANQRSTTGNNWKQARAWEIARLHSDLAELRQQCDDFEDNRELRSGRRLTPERNAVITPASGSALARLENLDAEVEEALALPAVERRQKLLIIARGLRFRPTALLTAQSVSKKKETPTYTTRTTHR